MAKDPSQTKIPRLDGVSGSRIPMPGSFNATRTSGIPGSQKNASKIGKPSTGINIGVSLRQQASNLLPKNLTSDRLSQVANLVRAKTANTFQNRFQSAKLKQSPVPTVSKANLVATDQTMVLEDLLGCRAQEAQTPESAPESRIPNNMTATLVRSETFEMTAPSIGQSYTSGDVSQMLQPLVMLQTSSPHCDSNASKRKFEFDDSSHIFDSSEVQPSDITKIHVDQIMDTTNTIVASNPIMQPTNVKSLSKYLIDNTTPKSKLNELTQIMSPSYSPIVNHSDQTHTQSPIGSTTFPVDKICLQSTMIVDEPKQVDLTTNVTRSHTWNLTEVRTPNSATQLMYLDDGDLTLVGQQQDLDSLMDVDEMEVFKEHEPTPKSVINNATITTGNDRTTTISTEGNPPKPNRFSFGLDLTEFNLDCSIDLCDISITSNSVGNGTQLAGSPMSTTTNSGALRKQNSFEIDESLGILTPDQMKEFMDSNNTNALNADLLLNFPDATNHPFRIDMTPSPEELPLDPIEIIKSDQMPEVHTDDCGSYQHHMEEQQLSQTDSDPKTDQMSKSTASKVSGSNSCFITSITSITSLDTGYQGDGEMSRPASRGAGAHSPSSAARLVHQLINRDQPNALAPIEDQQHPMIVPRRTADPMTDSDFFTESDADDAVNRGGAGDRRAQIIDGHLYDGAGGEIDAGANVFIVGRHHEGGESMTEDSCMESSGIFTDVENRGDEDLGQLRSDGGGAMDEHDDLSDDMSPNGSTDTIKSNTAEYNSKANNNNNNNNNASVSVLMASTEEVEGSLPKVQEESTAPRGHACNTMSASTSSSINSRTSDQISVNDCLEFDKTNHCANTSVHHPNKTVEHLDTDGRRLTTTNNDVPRAADQPNTNRPPSRPTSAGKSSPSSRRLATSSSSSGVSGTRKQNKNEANVAIKKTELHASRRVGVPTASPGGVTRASGRVSSAANKSKSNVASADGGDRMVGNNDQENRRPNSASTVGPTTVGSAVSSTTGVATARKCTTTTPNKWDAVMNKIATNKSAVKTRNYSAIKSKVTCGLSKRGSPAQLKSPVASDQPTAHPAMLMDATVLTAKRLFAGPPKRVHTHSKDSSESDLSVSGVVSSKPSSSPSSQSPESRTAKKRDVRSISISPSDLGPPSKTNGHPKTAAAAAATTTNNNNSIGHGGPNSCTKTAVLQKRFAANGGGTASVCPASVDTKSSPPAKKGSTKISLSKTPLKDHNRLATITPINPTLKGSAVLSPSAQRPAPLKSTSSPAPVASPDVSSGPHLKAVSSPVSTHSSSSPNHTNHHHHHHPTAHPSLPIGRGGNGFDSTTLSKIRHQLPPASTTPSTKHEAGAVGTKGNNGKVPNGVGPSPPKEIVAPSAHAALVETVSKAVSANLGCGGGGNACGGKGVEALGVLIQYLVFNLDAFGNAHWQQTHEKTNYALMQTQVQLDNARATYQRLDSEMQQKEQIYAQRENDFQEMHRAEIQKAQDKEAELLKRISELSSTENELREKVQASENEFGDRLRIASQRERDLNEKLNALGRQLATLSKEAELKERQITEKMTLCQDELAVMRQRSINETSPNTPQRMLQDEVESLRCVLDLKQQEISDLRKQNHELIKDNDTLPAVTLKVHTLESRLEDIQLQLKQKCNEEKELRSKLKQVEQNYTHETSNRKSLSLRNEQLQWKLMQNSEKFTTTLNELSKRYMDHSDYLNSAKDSLYGQENSSQSDLSASDSISRSRVLNTTGELFHIEDISPPSTPVVKGVVEKNESVSWVLEMNDEESAEALTSRIVRRAGSFRSNLTDKFSQQPTPAKKRQLSQNNHPLSQSASAAAVLRQFSEGSPTSQQKKTCNSPISRSRSKSVSTSNNPKFTRDLKKLSTNQSILDAWIEPPLFSSSPRRKNGDQDAMLSEESEIEGSPKIVRGRSNSFTEAPGSKSGVSSPFSSFRRSNSYRPTSANSFNNRRPSSGTSNGRVEHVLHVASASIQDSPKFQQIKESAGEAMVSGTNSEDEEASSTGSSDESMSVSSGRTTNSSHSHFVVDATTTDKMQQRRMSLEDVMMHEIEASLSRSLDDGF